MSTPEAAIADYLAAYAAANGKDPDFRLVYRGGWVEFRSRASSWVMNRRRVKDLRGMTDALQARVAALGMEACQGRNAQQSGAEHDSPSA